MYICFFIYFLSCSKRQKNSICRYVVMSLCRFVALSLCRFVVIYSFHASIWCSPTSAIWRISPFRSSNGSKSGLSLQQRIHSSSSDVLRRFTIVPLRSRWHRLCPTEYCVPHERVGMREYHLSVLTFSLPNRGTNSFFLGRGGCVVVYFDYFL